MSEKLKSLALRKKIGDAVLILAVKKVFVFALIVVVLLGAVFPAFIGVVRVNAQNMPPFTLTNAEEPLFIPTYDGSGQAVHPSILYFESGYPYKYIMAFTPLPNGNDDYENPSVAFSNDGIEWETDGVENPLDYPYNYAYYHLADPEIVWDGKEFKLYYIDVNQTVPAPHIISLKVVTSKDGVHWSEPRVLFTERGWVSPTVIYEADEGKYKMWYVNYTTTPFTIWYAESEDGFNWSHPILVNFPENLDDKDPWHPEVQKLSNGMYMMLIAFCDAGTRGANSRLYLATSYDGFNWVVYDGAPILDVGPSGSWDDGVTYRASFIVYNSTLHVWYSARNSAAQWHIGYTVRDISDFLGGYGVYSDNV
ncbi:MAG: exo-alpha-sialidase, partial [Candidatus Thorarchaeota archaeon]